MKYQIILLMGLLYKQIVYIWGILVIGRKGGWNFDIKSMVQVYIVYLCGDFIDDII